MKDLLIDYAIERETGLRITAEQLGQLDNLDQSKIRIRATQAHKRQEPPAYRCVHCSGHLYPRGLLGECRVHWKHYGDKSGCPLDLRTKLTPDQVSAIIFRGRQEGEEHTHLRQLLYRLAQQDPLTEPESVTTNQYDRPESETGCYPDVLFRHSGRTIVLEVQLAPVSLATIATRRKHYASKGSFLLWVTRNFDPGDCNRLFKWDIIADQNGVMFSIDDEVVRMAEADNRLRLRRFEYHRERGKWSQSIVTMDRLDLIRGGEPLGEAGQWARSFKRLWSAARFRQADDDTHEALISDLLNKLGIEATESGIDPRHYYTASVISTLLSIESGSPIGYGGNLIHMINRRVPGCFGGRCYPLFKLALERFQPALLEKASVLDAFKKAKDRCSKQHIKPFDRNSHWGEIWNALFPEHHLG